MSIAESTEEVLPEGEVGGPSTSAKDKVLAGIPAFKSNGSRRNGSTVSTSSTDDEEEQRHLPSFEVHSQKSDSEKGGDKEPAFQSMDLQGDSDK